MSTSTVCVPVEGAECGLKTMTLYSENNGKTCCKLVICNSDLLFPIFANSDPYNGIALRFQIRLTIKRLMRPH